MMIRLRRSMLPGALLTVGMLSTGVTAVAQASYTVFPAKQEQSNVALGQPTSRNVTIVVRDSTVKYLLNELARQAHLRPMYVDSPSLLQRVSVSVENVNAEDALAVILRGTGLEGKVAEDGVTLVIRAVPSAPSAPRGRHAAGIILGRVTDSVSGRGLGGASVRVEGQKGLSTVTSDSGNFVLKDVPAGEQTLTVRLFGYRPRERTVTVTDSERVTVKIMLVAVANMLTSVVTTATGTTERYKVGNDITVLHADSIQQIAPVSNLTQMLETRVPGLIVQHTSGIPGAPSRLRLRGTSSINMSSDPILIVDGIRMYADQSASTIVTNPSSNGDPTASNSTNRVIGGGSQVGGYAGPSALDQIDPNSIETIEVLKGPSATAIYGSDAAAGVIVVTTKRGKAGPTHWSASVDVGRTTLPSAWPTNYYLFGHTRPVGNPTQISSSQSSIINILDNGNVKDSLVAFQALNDPSYSPLTGQPGQNRDASLTVSGGSGAVNYSVTGTASTQVGYLHLPSTELVRFQAFHGFPAPGWMRTPDNLTSYGANSNMSFQLGQQSAVFSITSSLYRSAQQQSSLQSDLATLSATYVDTSQLASTPLFTDYYERAQLRTTTFNNSMSLQNWAPWRWLPLTATVGLSVGNQDNNTVLPRDYITCQDSPHDPSGGGCAQDSLGTFHLQQATNTNGTLTIGTTIAPQRLVSTAIGLNIATLAQSAYGAQTQGLPLGVLVPTQFLENLGPPSYSTANTATYGWYVVPTLNFHSRFFASPGFRLDGGSGGTQGGSTGGVNSLSLFPKLDFSWIAVDRPPSNPLFGALTLLRPRVAFGIAGIQPSPGQQLRLLQPSQVIPPLSDGAGTPVDILQAQTLGNPQLHPERDDEFEGGFDAEFWNQRLTLTLTGYHKTAYDAILAIPVALSVLPPGGASGYAENIGTIRNTGIGATVSARILDNRVVDWSVNTNFNKNNNTLTSLAPGLQSVILGTPTAAYTSRLVPGYPVFGIWANPIQAFYDVNHNGLIEPNETIVGDSAVFVGAPEPNYEMTLSTTIGFFNNRLNISTAVDYQNGLTQSLTTGATGQFSAPNKLTDPTLTPAQQAALSASVPQVGGSGIGLLQTVSALRWQSLSINYLAPSRIARLVHVPTLSVALQGSNLGLHTSYRGADPGVNSYTSGNQTQDSGGELPQPRIWNLRVTVGY